MIEKLLPKLTEKEKEHHEWTMGYHNRTCRHQKEGNSMNSKYIHSKVWMKWLASLRNTTHPIWQIIWIALYTSKVTEYFWNLSPKEISDSFNGKNMTNIFKMHNS